MPPITVNGSGADSRIPSDWIGKSGAFPKDLSVVDFFRAQVKARPSAPAVKEGSRLMSYLELDLHSSRIAIELRRLGLNLEQPVAVLRSASCEFIAAILGVLKAGGAYLPVAMDTPRVRLQFLLEDSGCQFALTDGSCLDRFAGWGGQALELAPIIRNGPKLGTPHFLAPTDPRRVGYVTYTSGSTGQPKGVEIEHHSWTNFVFQYGRQLGLSPDDRSSVLACLSFDAAVADIWPTLCAGGCVVIPPHDILLDPDRLIGWLTQEQVTLSLIPTALAEILFARPWPKTSKLRWLVTGGDRLRARPPADFPVPVLNGYGPTENAVVSTLSVVDTNGDRQQFPPIGKPFENVKAYVLDDSRVPVGLGETGELYLGGEQVARGYLRRPELTAERFLPDPFSAAPGSRIYRTGDWVRWLPDGQLEFVSRQDDQIQIRGIRVELGEIEAALCSYDGIVQACCAPVLDDGMPAGISAHIVRNSEDGAGFLDGLKSYLEARLPSKSMPSEYIFHQRLPVTPRGKLDRKALLSGHEPVAQTIETTDSLEESLLRVWRALLPGARTAGAQATFQQLGGDSLLGIKLMLAVEEVAGKRLEQSTFLRDPTFAGLCREVKRRLAEVAFEPIIALQEKGDRPPLFCLYGLDGDVSFRSDFASALGSDQPVWGMRSPALDKLERLPVSMEAAAEEARLCIRRVYPKGPMALIGYSWGGLLAFEVARQFARAEGISCFTAVVGTGGPPEPPTLLSKSWRFASLFPRWFRGLVKDRAGRRRRLANWRNMLRNAKHAFNDSGAPLPSAESLPDLARGQIGRHFLQLANQYQPSPIFSLELDFFRESGSEIKAADRFSHPLGFEDTVHLPDAGWRHWCRKMPRIHVVEGDHNTILKPPHVLGLAKVVRGAIDEAGRDASFAAPEL